MATPLEIALQLDAWGFNVIPARGKQPTVNWRPYQHERTTRKLRRWFAVTGSINYWVVCGQISGWVCLDCDSEEAEQYWRVVLTDQVMDAACCVRTAKGHHYWFRIPEGVEIRSWSNNQAQADEGIRFDIRGEGAGAIVPPSVHDTGHIYEWVRDPTHRVEAPEALLGPSETSEEAPGPPARSMLSKLLGSPPEGEGGRNVWLAQVAGHYAKQYRQLQDAYETHVDLAAALLAPPLPEAEVSKLRQSIWDKEHRKTEEEVAAQTLDEYCGWLVSGGNQLLTEATEKRGQETVTVLKVWADFDMRAVGVVEDEAARRIYDVEIHRHRHGDMRRALLPSAKLADSRTLHAWLAEYGVSIMPPNGERHGKGSQGARLLRYLESQEPPRFAVVPSLGWHGGGFICHEGVITADGLVDFSSHKPDPRLRNWAPYRYGFDIDLDDARAILREVLTFQDATVCSVFGAWWAACLLKGQMQETGMLSQFPFMALEAPSESGKTTGFFALMTQLNGNYQGQTAHTTASLRDAVSAHQSGIVWIDDISDLSHLMDLLRQTTGEGTVNKKGEDRHTQEAVQLVAPVVLSGESLQLSHQKALLDRAVILEVPSPTERRSLHDPDRMQWDDVVRMHRTYPDLTKAAGTLVQAALGSAELLDDLPGLRIESGRFGDKIAVLRVGARLLDRLCDTGDTHTRRVDQWCFQQESVGDENTLTLKLIPAALARLNLPRRPEAANGRWPATPVFIDGANVVWYSPQALADWWFEIQHGRIEKRTESAEALDQQSRVLGEVVSKRFRLVGNPTNKPWYRALNDSLSEAVYLRAMGQGGTVAARYAGPKEAVGLHTVQQRLDWEANLPPEWYP